MQEILHVTVKQIGIRHSMLAARLPSPENLRKTALCRFRAMDFRSSGF